jgi:ERO1-like protein beta
MRNAARVFYLAVFTLLGTTQANANTRTAAPEKIASSNVCAVSHRSYKPYKFRNQTNRTFAQYEPHTIVSDACASYSTLEGLNEKLHPYVHQLTTETDFFSHYRLNLYHKKCPFWSDENGMCGNRACAVNTLDNEEDIPLAWRADELGKLEGPKAHHPGKKLQQERPAQKPLQGQLGENVGESCVVEYDDECDERDYCVPEDESATSKGDYVSLVDNPERFTGYAGAGANQVWEAIYRENCFHKPPNGQSTSPGMTPFGLTNPLQAQAALDLKNVMKEHNVQQGVQQAIAKGSSKTPIDELEFDDECVEKRVFYRLVSGMHASISTHLCWEWFNQTSGEWAHNVNCYKYRLHNHPERVSNMYFNYALLLRAVGKIRPHLKNYSFCSADPQQDRQTKQLILTLSDQIGKSGDIFDETVMFKSRDAIGLKEDFKTRFRNVSRIMDCVGCDKCRLWGKVQTNGYGTALKILFEFDDKNPSNDPPLRRTELVALLNTLDRVSHSLQAVQEFTKSIEAEEARGRKTAPSQPIAKTTPTSPLANKSSQATLIEDEDDGYPDFKRKKPSADMTLGEIFWEEFDLVFRVFKFVIRGWIEFPFKL